MINSVVRENPLSAQPTLSSNKTSLFKYYCLLLLLLLLLLILSLLLSAVRSLFCIFLLRLGCFGILISKWRKWILQ